MAAEAHKLINISLTKIAKSRAQRGGVSLHRNLLVATVLQKARFVFMDSMVQLHDSEYPSSGFEEEQKNGAAELDFQVRDHIASEVADEERSASADDDSRTFVEDDVDKENISSREHSCTSESEPKVRGDGSILREKLETNPLVCSPLPSRCVENTVSSLASLKRRRAVISEWETEEAVLSILPKKAKREEESSFVDEVVTVLPFNPSDDEEVTSMDIDRITSLVSIFSFGGLATGANSEVLSGGVVLGGESVGKLTRSVSTPDLCSAQAKEGSGVDVMQRPFLAMTV